MKHLVTLVQVNFAYGENVFVPYAVGSIQAYAMSIPAIAKAFEFQPPVFLRELPADVVSRMRNPKVVGISCYLWNWEYNKVLAKLIRAQFPECLIVFGGTQVPDKSDEFFKEHPYVDLLVHHEGEVTFSKVLLQLLNEVPSFTEIPGLSIRVNGTDTHKTAPSERIKDLSILPSPYLTGVFDIMAKSGYKLNATQETNRGCPYECTFCDWGGSTYSKVKRFDDARILAEFEWFGKRRVEYLFNADANYGIFPRDVELIRGLVAVRQQNGGYPIGFRMCTAKNSGERVFEIVKMLNDHGMNKGATLSFQSMDKQTLEDIKRSNIKMGDFDDWMGKYAERHIATYTELIMGMPGETYESTKAGIDTLFANQAGAVNIYAHACTALPNSEMSERLYVALHGIKTVRMPILLAHSTPDAGITEYHHVIVETKTMPHQEWLRTYMFYWAIQCFHCLGLTKHISMLLHKIAGIKYSDFYESLFQYFGTKEGSLISEEMALTRRVLESAVKGGRLDRVDARFGELYWPLEEMSFLTFVENKVAFYQELLEFLQALWNDECDAQVLANMVLYQETILRDPFVSETSVNLRYDLPRYLQAVCGEVVELEQSPVRLTVTSTGYAGDLKRFSREVVWYGRRGGSFHHRDVVVENL